MITFLWSVIESNRSVQMLRTEGIWIGQKFEPNRDIACKFMNVLGFGKILKSVW